MLQSKLEGVQFEFAPSYALHQFINGEFGIVQNASSLPDDLVVDIGRAIAAKLLQERGQ